MPATEILVFREANGRIPMEDWLDFLPTKARGNFLYYMRLLAASGHELRRPIADILRDEIYELRPSHRGVYFFRDRDVVVLSHGIMKRQKVPDVEIRRAAERKRLVLADPQRYSFRLVPKEV